MADDEVLWFEKVDGKCQDFICVRSTATVMNFCGEDPQRGRDSMPACNRWRTISSPPSDFYLRCPVTPHCITAITQATHVSTYEMSALIFMSWPMISLHAKSAPNLHFRLQSSYSCSPQSKDFRKGLLGQLVWPIHSSCKAPLIHNVDGPYPVT